MSGVLHAVVWEDLEQFVKRVARLAIVAGMKAEALELLRNLRDDRENKPLVTFVNLRAKSLLERIDELRKTRSDELPKNIGF
jgi:hypothetical protein